MTYEDYKNSGKFDDRQLSQIKVGFENGLSQKQVELYAGTKFNYGQMHEIRLGFQNGSTQEQVELYAKPEFNGGQMHEIRFGFESGLSQEQIELYAKPEFNDNQMEQIRLGLQSNIPVIIFKSTDIECLNASEIKNLCDEFLKYEFGDETLLLIENMNLSTDEIRSLVINKDNIDFNTNSLFEER